MATVIVRNIEGAGTRQVVPFRRGGLQPLQVTDTHVVIELFNDVDGRIKSGYSVSNCLTNLEGQQLALMLNTHFARLNRKANQKLANAGRGRPRLQLVLAADTLPAVEPA